MKSRRLQSGSLMRDFGVLLLYLHLVQGLRFTMINVNMTLPGFVASAPVSRLTQPIVTLRTTKDDEAGAGLRFSMNDSRGLLQVDPFRGEVYPSPKFYSRRSKEIESISATVYVEDITSGLNDSTRIHLNVFPIDAKDCNKIVEEVCFWTDMKYQVEEDMMRDLELGSLSSSYLIEMCSIFKVAYTITDDNFYLLPPDSKQRAWSLALKGIKNRDRGGRHPSTRITCYIEDTGGKLNGSKWEINRDIKVSVLDVNNNPPKPQYRELNISMPRVDFKKGQEIPLPSALFTDEDGITLNNYQATIPDIPGKFLQPICSSYVKKDKTAIRCRLKFTQDKVFPSGKFSFSVRLNDTTFRGKGISQAAQIAVHLLFPDPQPLTMMASRKLMLYPKPLVKIFRTAAPFARVTQPEGAAAFDCKNFRLTETKNGVKGTIFNITENMGIVYVQDYKKMRNPRIEYISLNISWSRNNAIEFDEIQVRIINEPNQTCGNISRFQVYLELYCAQYETANECHRADACALSTGGSASVERRRGPERCMWRGDRFAQNITHIYSTCTPDTETCPDGTCDPLEELHEMICPQDCTRDALLPLKINSKTGRGIDEASGAVICHRIGGCTSIKRFDSDKGSSKKSRKHSTDPSVVSLLDQSNSSKQVRNVTSGRTLEYQIAKCGTFCIIGTGAGIFVLGSFITFIVVCWRSSKTKKMKREKYSEDNHEMTAPLSVSVRDNIRSEPLMVNFQMFNPSFEDRAREIIKKHAPDAKWEFPREQLVIEQTLGEGEFGRVLRAKAFNIGGLQGYTTVAVKTLKEDARDAELNDLLSEYQLLKEISHPNVISLLGVCTSTAGPVYLIIEYAEYGSLRNYLRRSRKLLGDSQDEAEVHYDEPKQRNVTPKDLLSFGWQICNGMAYLSDIKLVHRDLAARNVLLAENKICKISDFGLTRDVYEDNAYLKRSKGRVIKVCGQYQQEIHQPVNAPYKLSYEEFNTSQEAAPQANITTVPVKWMAPESLADHIYTSKSDVWSFGILVWELVTLGATPYPGIAVQNLFHLLKQGYRMERPDNCSPALYEIMKSCWHLDPEQRPGFHELLRRWEKLLEDKTVYVNLSNNAIHNRGYFLSPFEEKEDNSVEEDIGINSFNYMSRSESYEKCGEVGKSLDGQSQDEQLATNTIQGYETPVKVPKKVTPQNEGPEEYTDMNGK